MKESNPEHERTPIGIREGTHPYHTPEGIPAKVYPVRASTGEGYTLYDTTEGVWFGRRSDTYQEAVERADRENRRLWESYKAMHPQESNPGGAVEVTKLTGDIWDRMTPIERERLGLKAQLDAERRGERWIGLFGEEKRALIREFKKEQVVPNPKEPWQMTLEEYALEKGARPAWVKAGYGETYRTHKRAVERAISEGKPVPAVVLADYLELGETFDRESNPGKFTPEEPRGTCYEDAWRFLIREEEGELVHGSIQTIGKRINHAWVELPTGFVWEPESGEFMKKSSFYERAEPQVQAKYTAEEAAIMLARVGKHGPWTDEERARWLKRSNPGYSTEVSSSPEAGNPDGSPLYYGHGKGGGTEVYVEELPKCNFCDKPAHYDGKTTMGPWAYMCEEHFKMYGIGLGTGKGQKLIPRKALREAEKLRGEPEKELSVTMTDDDLGVAAYEEVWYPKCPYCGAKTPTEPDAHAVYCEACGRRFKIINPFFSSGGKLASSNPGGRGAMDELRAKQIAEEAAVKAVELQGQKVAEQVAKEMSGELLHQSPVSPHCERVLEEPPLCYDFRGIRSWILCRSWQRMEQEGLRTLPVGESWQEARRVCKMP